MIMKIEKFEDREVEVFLERRIYEKGGGDCSQGGGNPCANHMVLLVKC